MDEFVTPYDEDDAQFIECKVRRLHLTQLSLRNSTPKK